jgi:hypothetical protein
LHPQHVTTGLHLQVSSPPEPGTYIELRRGSHVIVARVIWSREQECGARAQDLLHLDEIIQNREHFISCQRCGSSRSTSGAALQYGTGAELRRNLSSTIQFGSLVLIGLSLASAAVSARRGFFHGANGCGGCQAVAASKRSNNKSSLSGAFLPLRGLYQHQEHGWM